MSIAPFIPTPFPQAIANPAIGSSGAPAIPYVSNAEYDFAPTAVNISDLSPGGTWAAQWQSLADQIRRASRICDSICFGSDAASKGASLAASLTVDSAMIRIKGGELRLVCDYRPLVQLVGVALGSGMSNLSNLVPSLAALARPGRRTWYIPYGAGLSPVFRNNDAPGYVPGGGAGGSVYAVWSYVNGYPHTSLAANVAADATTCVVNSTDGNGGLWGVIAASGAFPGTDLEIVDGVATERVFVQSITTNTPSTGLTTLTTSAFANAHQVPALPDFIPVTAVPENVREAVISLTTWLIKTRGARGLVMPTTAGGRPTGQAMGQSGSHGDYERAHKILSHSGLIVRNKHPGSY